MLPDCGELLAPSDQNNVVAVFCKPPADSPADRSRTKDNKSHDELLHGIQSDRFGRYVMAIRVSAR